MTNYQTLRGMVDLLPDQSLRWQAVEGIAREHFRRANINEIRTPVIEATELFERSIGEATDVVGKEMYSFLDRGKRSCTLRPEGTAAVVRSVIQHGLLKKGPQRLWYSGPMFRYERPQAGRMRQFHQLGVEFFGLPSFKTDAEIIVIAWDLLNEFGLKNLKLELNTLGSSEDRKSYQTKLVLWLESNIELLDEDSKKRINTNPLRILDSKNPKTIKLLQDAPLLYEHLSESSLERFSNLKVLLNKMDINFTFNPKLVRGLDYYCHTAFEITSDQLGSQSTLCGGGRYNNLVKELGGEDTSAIGWAIGMERLLLLLNDDLNSKSIPDVYFVNKGIEAESKAIHLSRMLRISKISVDLDNSGSSFQKQFKRANRSNAKWALILGDEEVLKGKVRIKSLQNSEEKLIDYLEVETIIKIITNSY